MCTRFPLLAGLLFLLAAGPLTAQTERGTLDVDGRARTFLLHVPTGPARNTPLPLVFVFHGGGGQGAGTERLTQFSRVADREKFIVVYPDGIDRKWNDGRNVPGRRDQVNDVKFVSAMIEAIATERPIDRKRVYATGISNGAIFSHLLAVRLADKFAAIAPVAGGIAEEVARNFNPADPVSILVIQGTLDPLVPFAGGAVARNRGRIVSTSDAVQLWVARDHCSPNAIRGELPDRQPRDGCRVRTDKWPNGHGGAEVALYTIEGGGHTWPGGTQYLPKWLIGAVCRDFDASEEIWNFFKQHPKR